MADKKFTLTFDVEGNLSPIKGAVKDFQSTIKSAKFQIPVGIQGNIDKIISKLNAEIAEFESLTSQGFGNMADIGKAEKSFAKITSLMRQLGSQGEQIKGLDPKKFLPKEILDRTAKLEKAFNKLGDIKINTKKIESQTEAVRKQKEEVEELKTKYEALAAENKTSGARKGNLSSSIKSKEKELEVIQKQMEALEKVKGGKSSAEYSKLNSEFKTLSKTISAQKAEFASLDTSINKNKTTMSGLKVQLDSAASSLDQMEEQLKQLQLSSGATEELENLRKQLAQLKNVNIDEIPTDLEEIKRVIGSLDDEHIKVIKNSIKGIEQAADNMVPSTQKAADSLDDLNQEGKELTRVGQEIENLKGQVLDFFSITNTIQIFKNAVRDAFDTVKELDAVMTETAVVTDFSIGDMWDKLPEYSDEANKLGTSISSLYEATTLYYQQGLESQEAMDVGIETMKMARIANMDAAAATEAMTAALRGFNMEINEMSATRINDVYSELAAITAADTSQIATAMSKTASIAASANMEFETTAALLAQIIETTQEAPETAGTAMKTIIARFTEVKQLFDEGMLTGKDSEGEEININKIDAALKKVGISLSDFLRGEKGIDDIFLELASKWDSLDLATQRYIATTAAGSRQQSRFLAMMSNYGRTMELVTAANNSAGASQKQFDKTLESLEAKLQRLKNAWAEFTMGLANNELIKGAVDLLTTILEKLNQFTDFGSEGAGGVITLLTRLGTVLLGLKGGEAILNTLLKSFKNVKLKEMLGVNELVGIKEIFGKLKQSGEDVKHFGNDVKGAIEILKDPSLRGEAFEMGRVAIGNFGTKAASVFAKFGPWVALAVTLGAAIYGLAKSFKAAQSEAKLDNINQALADLNTEAQNAQDELDKIGSARTELNGLQDTLNGLTKGTAEWKSALVDVNRQVLELIEKYPSLEYELGANGALQIKQESWDNLLAQQQKVITNMAAQRLDLESQRANIVKDIDFEKFVVDSYGSNTRETDKIIRKANKKAIRGWDGNGELILPSDQVMGQTKFERWMAQAEMDMAQWYQNSPLLAWLADVANAASGNVYIEESETAKRQRLLNENENYYVDEVAEKLVGLNQTEITALAAEFAREGENSQTIDQTKFIKMLETATGKEWTNDAAEKLLNSIKEFDKATNSFNDLIQTEIENQISQESLTRQFTMNALTGSSIIEKDYADSIVNIISKGEKEAISAQVDNKVNELKDEVNEKGEKVWTPEKIAAEYARIMGYQAVGEDVYTNGTYSQKVDASQEAMLRAIATETITVEVQEKAEKTTGAIGKEKEQEKLFNDLFSTDSQKITSAQIAKYQNVDGTIKYDDIAKDVSDYNTLKDMAEGMNQDEDDLIDILISNFKTANERITTQRKDLAKRMTKYSGDQGKSLEENAQDLAGLEAKFGDELGDWIRNSLDSALTSLERTGDEEVISAGLEFFRNVAIAGTKEEVEELSNFISDIDWSNPIDAAYRLNQELKNGTELTQGFVSVIDSVGSEYLSIGSQFQALTTTDQFDNLNKALEEIYNTQGEILGSDVRKLASEYSYLNKMMKNASVTGSGLAMILTSIQKGELSFNRVTDAVIAAVGKMDQLGEATDKVLQKLGELDLGNDLGEVQDKYAEFSDKMKEWQEGAEYGNPQYENLLNYTFGSDWDVGYGEEKLVPRMQELSKIISAMGEDMFFAWDRASQGLDIYGNKIDEDGIKKLNELEIVLDNVNGEVVFQVPDNLTFDQVTSALSEVFGASKEMWDDLITYFQNRDPNFRRSWIAADYKSMGDRIVESETTEVGGKKIVTQQEIRDIATVQAGKVDKDVDTIIADIKGQLEKYEGEITIIPNLEGLETGEIVAALNKAFGGSAGSFAQQFTTELESGVKTIDLYGLYTSLTEMGLSSQIASEIANGAAAGADVIVSEVDGETISFKYTEDGDFVGELNRRIEEAKAKAAETPIEETATVTIDQTAWEASVNSAKTYIGNVLSGLRYPVKAYVSEVDTSAVTNSGSSSSPSGPAIGSQDWYLTYAAEGDPGVTRERDSLVGEEGPELIETADGAYLSGVGGPQVTRLHRGDVVHTAEETEEIFKRKGVPIPAYKGGTLKPAPISGGSGGTSKDNDEETWENPFDKLYNLVRKIDEELRQRERIERRYEKLLESIDTSANKIIAVSREELAQLERERVLQEQLISGRKYQINQYQSENTDLTKYANVVQNDRGEDVLRINWDLINSVTDTDEGQRIEDYVSQLEEWFDDLEAAEEALWDIEDAVEEIKERGEDQYFELENAIKEAIVQSYQDEIDKLSEINNSINDTNSALLDAMQKSLDKQRQERENKRTEDDLAEKQRRLLYLQQDTSGANAMEILQLQKEIEEGQEDYTDSLIDQKISELQEQNDEAAKQREQQIILAQTQLDHYIKTGQIWEDVYALMNEGLDADNGLVRGSRLEELLKNAEGFQGMSAIKQMEWMKDTNDMIAQALAYLEIGRQLEDIGAKEGSQIEFTTKDGKTLTGTIDEAGNVKASDGKTYNNVFQGADGKYYAGDNIEEVKEPEIEKPKEPQLTDNKEVEKESSKKGTTSNYDPEIAKRQEFLNTQGYNLTVDGINGPKTQSAWADYQKKMEAKKKTNNKQVAFATGGLADFTGPAWLDGTKARPEMVLNQKDTQNFIQLRDILASIMERGSTSNSSTENNGDITYDIDINVESIGNDYDVEQVANKVKSLIGADARYRNNNAVSLMR